MAQLPAAVLWDMDGTLVDTEPYWIEAEFALAEQHGGTWSDEHALNLVGNDLLDSGRYIREHMGIDLEPSEIVEELLDGGGRAGRGGGAVAARGARAARRPAGRGVPLRAGHDVLPAVRRAVLAALPDGTFDAVVTGDAVSRGKPHPEPYLKAAAELLGVDAEPTAWRSRTPTPAPRRPRRPAAWSWSCPPRAGASGGRAGLPPTPSRGSRRHDLPAPAAGY